MVTGVVNRRNVAIFRNLAAGLTFVALTGPGMASDYLFPAESFGELLLVPNQSTGDNNALLRAQKGGAFEPISEFNPDDRYRKFAAPIARLDMLKQDAEGKKYVGTCTANLIAPGVLLTNYHCIPGMKENVKTLKSIAVFDYLREDQDKAPRYKVDITPIRADRKRDFALLRVYGKPGERFGYFHLKPKKAQPNQSLFIIHHPAGMPKRLTRFRCKAYAPEPYSSIFFRHRCDTLGGSSGSLVFNLNFEVVALHNRGGLSQDSNTSFNSGISIFSLMEDPQFASLAAISQSAGRSEPQLAPPKITPPAAPRPPEPAVAQPPASYHNPLPLTASAICDQVGSERICASSMLPGQGSGKYNYRMRNLLNNDGRAWVENRKDHGVGEWVLFDFGGEKSIAKIAFRNGYTRTTKTFSSNSRISHMIIELSTGSKWRVKMADVATSQTFALPKRESVKWVKLTIDGVYKGRKYADTALSYVAFR